uniref:Psoriasis susceptibility 1 candidate 1 n=1 Tax=Homo sapiens TaxID=9606 RepID=A0A140T8W9_HUMAN
MTCTDQKSHSQRALGTQTPALQGPQLLNTDPSSEETHPPTLILTDFATWSQQTISGMQGTSKQ